MLQIRLLGQFDVRVDGKRVTIPTRAAQSLLAYLVLTAGTSQRRERLAGMLWPEVSDESARKNLRQELWRIRKAISTQQSAESDYLIADEFTIKFNREAEYWLDVAQMERADLDLQSLIAGLSLYQGELLPGFYEEWVTLERERIQAVFDARMEQLLQQLIAAERWIAVQEWGERWLALSGVREPAYRALMLASGVHGDMAKVSSLYQRCTNELQQNLGVEPSPETRALYHGLLKGRKAPLLTAAGQPFGTITFLCTDIEGSTRLLEKLGDQYAVALGEHHQILRASIQKWNGREMETQGDSFFVTFARSIDAAQCAAEAQRALASHVWPQNESLRVRMGLHTGEPLISSTGYVGMDVHRAARIGDAGHGGQILLSQTTRDLIFHDLPEWMTIRDLGEHHLKDMKYPTPIYQLAVEGLAADFPPLRTKFTGLEVPTPGEAPFKGLQFFDVDDSELFFGRETLTAKLLNRLREANFLSVIIGASGSGKSSLVRAGVVPALKRGGKFIDGARSPEGSTSWRIHIITPTAHPLEALAIELTRDSESVTAAATFADDLSKDPRSLHFFLSRRAQTDNPSHALLVIDQFEELFTLCRDAFEREAFIDNLLTAISPSSPTPLAVGDGRRGEGLITLIITLRADFYAHLAQYPELRDAVAKQQEYIGPMTAEELRRAIEEPARRGHWEFEPGLVDLILRDVGDEPGALPLLSHALLETWKRRAGHMLTLKGYAEAGGVRGAIAHTAESLYQTLPPDEQMITRSILVRLTEFGEGTEDTRRRASFNELTLRAEDSYEVRAVLNRLAEARLVTLAEDTAQVAHEALIREWPRLREWLSQDREGMLLHRRLTEAAQEWELLERSPDILYRGARLAQAREWALPHGANMNELEREFLNASIRLTEREAAEREAQYQRELENARKLAEAERQRAEMESQRAEELARSSRQLRKRSLYLAGAFVIALIMGSIALFFNVQSNRNAVTAQNNAATAQVAKDNAIHAQATAEAERLRAETEKQIAVSRELAVSAVNNVSIDPERSVLLSLHALSQSHTKEAEEALHQSVQALRTRLKLIGHQDWVFGVAFSPDGKRLATSSGDQTAKVWDAGTGAELFTLSGHSAEVIALAFSPDGTRLATGSADGTAKVWDANRGGELFTLDDDWDWVNEVDFSPDGTRLVTINDNEEIRLWDAETGESLEIPIGQIDVVNEVAFSPDGSRLAASGRNGVIIIWDSTTAQELLRIEDERIQDITLGQDCSRATDTQGQLCDTLLVSGHINGLVKIWDAVTGEHQLTLSGHTNVISEVAISRDGTQLASASNDGTITVWDIATGRELLTLAGHSGAVSGIAFSPDGNVLASVSEDGTARIWDTSPSGSRELLTLGSGPLRSLALSPDEKRIITTGADVPMAQVWDAETGEELMVLAGHQGTIYAATYSPDGTRIATGSADNSAKVWNAVNGAELLTLPGHGPGAISDLLSGVLDVDFSPDGERLATAGADGVAKVWDANTGEKLLTLSGHTAGLTRIVFSPDGDLLATASDSPDSTARIWDAATGNELQVLAGHPDQIWGIAFSPDGKRLVTSGWGAVIKVWDVSTGEELMELSGHTGTVETVAFSADGNHLASAGTDTLIKIWDAATGVELISLSGHTGNISSVTFNRAGTRLFTASRDGTARVYALRLEDLMDLAKSRVTRKLTTEECRTYLHMEQCPIEP
jgi:WD40 repeat protein/DNA-binding SARP family transcriptional activator